MVGDIDVNLRPKIPELFLTKPNREIIDKISEAYDIKRETPITSLYELNFKIPYYIDINNEIYRNDTVDLIKERYHIKFVSGNKIEWYIITKIEDKADDNDEYKEIHCRLLPQELNDKLIREYSVESYNARQVLNDVLSQTIWDIDYLDADFELTYRSFEFANNTILDAVYKVAETYNAIVEWDTENRKLSFVKPELHGINRLGTLSYAKYLKSINRETDGTKIVTRLIPEGKDGLTIHRVNPTGQGYIEDFSYFMFPFERDENKNVIQHSNYMSDSLCHALLDFQELVRANEGTFKNLLEQKDSLDNQLAQKTAELNDLKNQLATITEIQLAQQFDGVMFFEKFLHSGGTTTKVFNVDSLYQYAVLVKVDNVSGKTLMINGQPSYMMGGTWVVSKKINSGTTPITVSISGSGNTEVFIQIANITTDEFNASGNEATIIEKYNFDNKEAQIRNKQNEIEYIRSQIKNVENNIDQINNLLDPNNNFTTEQLEELNLYITVEVFKDDNLIDDKDLFEEAKKIFDEIRIPQLSIKIDIVNFLEVIEEQRNWDELYLGDKVIIKYEPFNLLVEAKIINIEYDYENGNITLTIANFKDLTTGREQLERYIYDSNKTSSIVDLNKSKWGKAVVDTSEFSQIFENFWDSVTKQVNMANNEFVQIDARGVTIIDPHDPLRFLRATHGVLALTRSGGLRYESAITPDGIIAERLLGKILLTQRVTIGDDDGIWLTEGPKTTITDRLGRVAMKIGLYEENPDLFGILINRYISNDSDARAINKIIMNSEDGFKIQQWNGIEYKDKFYVDNDGLLYSEDMTTKRLKIVGDSNELLLDSYTKFMDIGKFENIVTDGKLTAIEKLQVLGEKERIQSEYQKLLAQAQAYASTTRDNTIRIDPTNYTNAYNALMAYLSPLLSNMDETSEIDRNEFINKFKNYYDETVNIINAINDSIKYSSVQFGAYFNNVIIDYANGIIATRSDNMYRSIMSGTRGFVVQQNVGTAQSPNWKDVFWADLDGTVHAQDIDIANSFFVNGEISGSRITLRNAGGVMKLDPAYGFWAGSELFGDAIASIAMDGTATFKKLIVKDGDNNLLIDSENKIINFGGFDAIGAGRIEAQLISANFVATDVGFISDLTASRLSTLTNASLMDWSNYIVIKENIAQWITGKVSGSGTHVELPDGRKLYWVESSQKGLITTEETPWPVMKYEMDEKVKMELKFEGSGLEAFPSIYLGLGDGSTTLSGKAIISKPAEGLEIKSFARSIGTERSIYFLDEGVKVYVHYGVIELEHDSGTKFVITQNGNDITMIHKTSGSITINTSGMTANINGNINLTASGSINITGTQYNFT
jgi:phage minor structural protein